MNKKNTYISAGIYTNIVQLIFCFIIYLLIKITPLTSIMALITLLVLQIFIWVICGFKFGMENKTEKIKQLFLSYLLVILPIVLITMCAYILFFFKGNGVENWTRFFFLGGPIIFWNRPLRIISLLIKNNAYITFLINYIILFISYFIGGIFALNIKIGTKKAKQKAELRKEERKQRRREIERKSYTGEINQEDIEKELKIRENNKNRSVRKKKKVNKKRIN